MNPQSPPNPAPENSPPVPTTETPKTGLEPDAATKKPFIKSKYLLSVIVVLVAGLLAFAAFKMYSNGNGAKATQPVNSKKTTAKPAAPLKNYGNKYASGVLPVGDKKYTTDMPKQGYIYACSGYANNISTIQNGGAGRRGPWFSSDGSTYDLNKKIKVAGSVNWQPSFTNTLSGANRMIATNDLPNHITGVFPVSASDPAYAYDKNPNTIKSQTINYQLDANPVAGTAHCMGGQVGVMLTGVLLFNGFDAEGRDAGAWEVQDNCDGHPEKEGQYHYHTLSSCIKDVSNKTVIGFALDGFPITGPKVGSGNIMTTSDLDECHGTIGEVVLDGRTVSTYHYVMTQDFPYSVSCFKSTPLQTQPAGRPPQ